MATLANTELGNTFDKWRVNTNVTTDRVKSITHSTDNGRIVLTGNVEVNTSDFVVDTTTSRVGIGVAAPTKELDVSGEVKISANVAVDTSVLYVDAENDRVGVGTATPLQTLDVNGTIDGTTLTDGTLSINSGNITSAGSITATTFTDGTISITGGDITSAGSITATSFSGGGASITSLNPTNLSTFVPINKGGTGGTTTPTAGAVAYGDGSSYEFSAAGSSGEFLISGGTGSPTWLSQNFIDANTANFVDVSTTASGVNYVTFVSATTGDDNVRVDTKLTYDVTNEEVSANNLVVTGDLNANGGVAWATPDTTTYNNETGDNVALDLSLSNNIEVSLNTDGDAGSNTFTFSNPINATRPGQIGVIKVTRTIASWNNGSIAFGGNWEFMGSIPDLYADLDAQNKYGYLDYYVDSATNIRANWSGANTSA